jgi:hypothetical protein
MLRADTDRTRLLAGRWGSWVLPYWMERQIDPASPAWMPDDGNGPLRNRAARDVVPVGTIGAPQVATVDPRGLVTPWRGGWSLDWWVGADDRWHLPSREVAVRQRAVDGAPVVETAMRVPGGDIVERVWAFTDPDAGPVLAVEMANEGRVPVALALAVRPYGVDGFSPVGAVSVDASGLAVDGKRAAWLPKPASRVAASTWAAGDVADQVLSGAAAQRPDASASCTDSMAQAAAILPLAHGTSFMVLVPLDPGVVTLADAPPKVVPPADAVVRGWATHRSRGARIVVPDAELAETFDAAAAQLMLAAAGARLDQPGTRTVAAVTTALDRLGLRDEVDPVVAGLLDGQRQGGQLGGDDPDPAATGAVLVAAGNHWRLGRDDALVDALAGPLAAGAHHRPGTGRLVRKPPPLGPSAAAWQLAGARRVSAALRAIGQDDAATAVDRSVGDLDDALRAGLAGGDIDVLELWWLGVVSPGAPDVALLLEELRPGAGVRGAVLVPAGLSPVHTARMAAVDARSGDAAAHERLAWLVEAAGPGRSWPDAVHPATGAGCGGDPWSSAAAAAFVELALDLLCVAEVDARGSASEVQLLPVLPDSWLGAGIEAHEVRTELGVVSFAVRWHGARPALLWEIEPHHRVDEPVVVRAPGLDPEWSSGDLKGDALLAEPVPQRSDGESEQGRDDEGEALPPDGASFS